MIQFDWQDLVFRDVHIVGSLVSTAEQYKELLALAEAKGVKSFIQPYALEDVNRLFDEWHQVNGSVNP